MAKAEKDPTWKRNTGRNRPADAYRPQESKTTTALIPLNAQCIQAAEDLWIRASQEEAFQTEIDELKKGKEVPKESRLKTLSVKIEKGLLLLRSRIDRTEGLAEVTKSPPILDGNHEYTKLYLKMLHEKFHHAGTEMIVNEARQQFWIIRLRPVTKTIVKSCLRCRIKKTRPAEPRTGDHPYCRLGHHQRPFTFVGLDYFGPMSVTVGRHHEKRYVALFTCLTTRALHLEVAGSLSADSAIMALRRMMSRRGCPQEIYSDNGTNFHGANKELQKFLQEEAASRSIKWRFIPPGAPFMGGAWERLVRTVKNALGAVLREAHPHEETLTTLLCEVEFTVNSRPLTHVSVEAEEEEALTPNHFLLGGSGRVPCPGACDDSSAAIKQHWRRAQLLADHFWARWLREYLPTLQHRREPYGRGPPLRVDDAVLIVDPTLPRNTWPRGRVLRVYPGADGIVRAADVQTAGGVLRRPTKRLVVLPGASCEMTAPTTVAQQRGLQ